LSDDRVAQTRILLRSLLDYLPGPRTWTGQLQQVSAEPGLAAGGRKPCETCGTRGRVHIVEGIARPCPTCPPRRGGIPLGVPPVHRCRYCPTCNGQGWIKARASDPEFDEYIGGALDQATRSDVSGARFLNRDIDRLTASIERLEQQAQVRAGNIDAERYGWEKHKDSLWRRGSYAELSAILARLRELAPNRYRLVWLAEILGYADADGFIEMSDGLRRDLHATVVAIARQMPATIRVPAELRPEQQARAKKSSLAFGRTNGHEKQRGERNTDIREMAAGGLTAGEIAPIVSLTKRRVQQIIAVASSLP
jgi:hypothetical protein